MTQKDTDIKDAKSLSWLGLVLAIFLAPFGLIVSVLAYRKSKLVHASTTMSLVGIIIGFLMTIAIYAPVAMAVLDQGLDKSSRELLVD